MRIPTYKTFLVTALSTLSFAAILFTSIKVQADDSKLWVPQDKWFYCSERLGTDESADKVIELIERASSVRLNGILWALRWDSCANWTDEVKSRFAKIKKVADAKKIEVIPIMWSIGYGTMLGIDENLAEGVPIKDLPMVARDGKIAFEPEPVDFPYGSMDEWKGNLLAGVQFQDGCDQYSFRDDKVAHTGTSSLRFSKVEQNEHGHGRIMYQIDLKPGTLYRAKIWIKAKDMRGNIGLQIYDANGNSVSNGRCRAELVDGKLTTDWAPMTALFRAPADGKTRIYAGVWDGSEGTFWLDDLSIEPIGLVNPLQRPGTPIVVKNADGTRIYTLGKDYESPKFRLQAWDQDAKSQELAIPSGSAIKDGDKVLVDFYYPPLVGAPQIGTCMSEPKVYELFDQSAKEIVALFKPKKLFLSMDEIRCAGTCKACKDRGISLAEILGDCITKQYEICKKYAPNAEVYIWSDMLDPNHNAHANYYACDGDYTGVWDLVPKDLVIACWWHEKREVSMKFFSERGFRTLGAAYYDTNDLQTCKDWLECCSHTKNCVGIMYTTWQSKYDLLEGFGKLLPDKK